MAVKTYPKKAGVKLSEHFTSDEFDCPCSDCRETLIDTTIIPLLESTRSNAGGALKVTSGYRCKNYQLTLKLRGYETAKGPSEHEVGGAADLMALDTDMSGLDLEAAARKAGFKAVGVGSKFIHVDIRADKERRWTYVRG